MNFKKSIILVLFLLSLVMIGPAALFGGGAQAEASRDSNLILATGGTSGTYYPFGGAIAQIWNKSIDKMNVTAQATGASKENLRLVGKGEADLAIVQNDMMDYAFKGIELFADDGKGQPEVIEGFRTVATLYPEVVQIVVSPDSGITSIAGMKGKKISVGDAGSGVEANAKQILEANGLSFADVNAAHLSFKESASAVKDKQLDGFFVTAGVPNAAIQELAALSPVKILAVDEVTLAKLVDKYRFYTKVTVPNGTYNGMTADVTTVAVNATLIVRKDLSEAVVYNLTKTLYEKQPELAQAHAKGRELSLTTGIDGAPVAFHPGALKYYQEKGLLK